MSKEIRDQKLNLRGMSAVVPKAEVPKAEVPEAEAPVVTAVSAVLPNQSEKMPPARRLLQKRERPFNPNNQ